MRSWKPYLWKELRESLGPALGALGVFLAISYVPSILRPGRDWYNGTALAVSLLGGPILALVAGVHAMGREQGAIEQFWRSRPVNLHRWLVAKHLVGLTLVWLVCWIPLAIQIVCTVLTSSSRPRWIKWNMDLAVLYSLVLLLIYSESFVLGQCIRKTLHAAILSVVGMALIFIVPLVVAPLSWLSVETLARVDGGFLDARSRAAFAGTLVALSVILMGLSNILFRRNVRIELDARTLGGSVAVILLTLTVGVAFPMRTNLVPEQVIPLPITRQGAVLHLAAQGNDVLVLFRNWPAGENRKLGLSRVRIGEGTSVVDEPIWFADPGENPANFSPALALSLPAGDLPLAHVLVREDRRRDGVHGAWTSALCLYTIALDTSQSTPIVHQTELIPELATDRTDTTACFHQGHLYIYICSYSDTLTKRRLLTFSLADPRTPLLIHSEDLADGIGWRQGNSAGQSAAIRLAAVADLDESTRLMITRGLVFHRYWTPAGDSRVLASPPDWNSVVPSLMLYEAGPVQNDRVPLRLVSQRRSAVLEGLLRPSYGELLYSSPLIYRMKHNGVVVYRVGRSQQIKRIGHYATADGFRTMVPLPGNRLVLAGDRLHVLDLSRKLPSPPAR